MTEFDFIRLQSETRGKDGIYGYYRTKEGREFLRALCPVLIRRTQFKEQKIASIISDVKATEEELRQVRSALIRWQAGQGELWQKDALKNEKHLRRLEVFMMSVDECRELLEDKAAGVWREDIGEALSIYISGMNPTQRDKQIAAVNSGNVPFLMSDEDELVEQLIAVRTKHLLADRANYYHWLLPVPERPFLQAQVIKVAWPVKRSRMLVLAHYTGYAIPSPDGKIYRFLSNSNGLGEKLIGHLTRYRKEEKMKARKVKLLGERVDLDNVLISDDLTQHPYRFVARDSIHLLDLKYKRGESDVLDEVVRYFENFPWRMVI